MADSMRTILYLRALLVKLGDQFGVKCVAFLDRRAESGDRFVAFFDRIFEAVDRDRGVLAQAGDRVVLFFDVAFVAFDQRPTSTGSTIGSSSRPRPPPAVPR